MGIHRVLERLGNHQTVQEMRNHLRSVGVEKFKKISMIVFLIWHYKQDWHSVVNAPQGENDELKKAEAVMAEVSKLLEKCQISQKDAAAKEKIALDAENEVKKRLKEVTDLEDAKRKKIEDLKKKTTEGSLVQRNRAAAELAAVESEDDLPLRKAKTTLEAAKRKAEKATKKCN